MNTERWAELRAASDSWLTRREVPPAEQELRALRGDVQRAGRRRAMTLMAGVASMAAGVAIVIAIRSATDKPHAITFALNGGLGKTGEVWGNTNRETTVTFSDGSEVKASSAAEARVVALSERGAEIRLEQGELHARVIHRDETRWAVHAGHFTIRVTGTSFTAGWDPKTERVRIAMDEGRVVVFGPCLADTGEALVGGESREWKCGAPAAPTSTSTGPVPVLPTSTPTSTVPVPVPVLPTPTSNPTPRPSASPALGHNAPDGRILSGSEPTPPTSNPTVPAPVPVPEPPPVPAPPEPTWRDLAKTRRYQDAWTAAKSTNASAQASSVELYELAEVARLAGDRAGAVQLYRSIRDRFSGSAEAARAAFQLGRLSGSSETYGWMQTYLREQPTGAFASETLGRLIELSMARGDRPTATTYAKQYLAQYPTGAHAEYARSVVGP